MADLNTLDMTGRLTRDPELRQTREGQSVCNFRVACNGVREEEVVFVDVDTWGPSAEACQQYLHKGSRVAVSGRLGVRDWIAQDGTERRAVECNSARVYFLETKAEAESHQEAAAVSTASSQSPEAQAPPPPAGAPDDDVPF